MATKISLEEETTIVGCQVRIHFLSNFSKKTSVLRVLYTYPVRNVYSIFERKQPNGGRTTTFLQRKNTDEVRFTIPSYL